MPNPRIMEGYTPGVDDDPSSYIEIMAGYEPSFLDPIADHSDSDGSSQYSLPRQQQQQQDASPHFRIVQTAPGAPPSCQPAYSARDGFSAPHGSINTNDAEQPSIGGGGGSFEGSRQSQFRSHASNGPVEQEVDDKSFRCLFWTLVAVCVCLIVVLVVAVVVLVYVITERENDSNANVISNNNRRAAFATPSELQNAVDTLLLSSDDGTAAATREKYGSSMSQWNVSQITDFSRLFDVERNAAAASWASDLSAWDVSNGRTFAAMFRGAQAFNSDLSSWQVGKATDFSFTFAGATLFNQGLSNWDMRSATTIESMFQGAASFNQDISTWELPSLTTMASAFDGAISFSQDLCTWNDHLPSNPSTKFSNAFTETACPTARIIIDESFVPRNPLCFLCKEYFDCFQTRDELTRGVDEYVIDPSLVAGTYGPIAAWCVNAVSDFSGVFSAARFSDLAAFNEDVSGWQISGAVTLANMFRDSIAFNQPLDAWDVSSVTNLDYMFSNATAFNQDLSMWNVGAVTSMKGFSRGALSFSQDLCDWGDLLDGSTQTEDAFVGTACPTAGTPTDLTTNNPGPFCTSCAPPAMADTNG